MPPTTAPTVQSLQDLMAQYNPLYDSDRQQINTNINNVQQSLVPQIASLDAAKTQGFADIAQNAQNNGVFYSGAPIDQQQQYLATKYLPARADAITSVNGSVDNLTGQLSKIDATVKQQAQATQQDQQTQLAKFQQDQAAQQLEQQKLAQQLYIAQMQQGGSGGLTAKQASDAALANAQFVATNYKQTAKPNGQGFAYVGPGGQAISAGQYAQATGQSLGTVLSQDPTPYAQAARLIIAGDFNSLAQLYTKNGGGFKIPPTTIRNDPDKLGSWLQSNYSALF